MYDIKNPLNPIWLQGLDVDGQAQAVALEDGMAYVAAGDGGVAIFDILDPFYTRQVGAIDTPGAATKLQVANDYLYIADDRAGLLVMDVRDPQRPQEVARYGSQVWDMWVDGQNLWLVTAVGVEWWTLAIDGRAKWKAKLPGVYTWVRARDGLLATGTLSGTVKFWQYTSQAPKLLGQFVTSGGIAGFQLLNEKLYLVGYRGGMQVVDVSKPSTPKLVAAYPATGQHTAVAIAHDAAFFAGENKLASVTLLPKIDVAAPAEKADKTELVVELPADLPRGRYHLLALGPNGQRSVLPNAIKLQFARPDKKNTTLDAFRRLLRTPLKPPAEEETTLPSSP